MTQVVPEHRRWAYVCALGMLALALAFPLTLMVFNSTLMFERGWHQYVGTAIFYWAVAMLGREWFRLRREERAFREAPGWLDTIAAGQSLPEDDRRLLPARLRQLDGQAKSDASDAVGPLMELNREISGLDQERTAGRYTLTRYILYLLPVIGFIGTVEGISRALMNISLVLPMVKDLDGFLNNLTGVTAALQVAFDSTLLALFLSAVLMFALTIVYRLAEDHLARVDAWVVEHVLPRLGQSESPADVLEARLERLQTEIVEALSQRLGDGFGPHVERFAGSVERLNLSVNEMQRGADAIGRVGDDLAAVGEANESLRRMVSTLARIEASLNAEPAHNEQLDQIRRGIERSNLALDAMADRWSIAFERSNKSTQEQLSRTMSSLKDALDLLQVSIEQGNTLYRKIVHKMFYSVPDDDRSAAA